MPDLRFSTHYTINGGNLDVDRLLTAARPKSRYRVWRRGEIDELGKRSATSGVQIQLAEGASIAALHNAVRRFLARDERFLRAASRLTGPKVRSALHTGLFVHEMVTLSLPSDLMRLASERSVEWMVTKYPCSD